jgi:hypothetical protein
MHLTPRAAIDWRAALWAGIAAGVTATLAQVLLWIAFTDAFPGALLRDARLTAAIVLGESVLPPPATFDSGILLVSALIHFALSLAYSAVLARMLARLPMRLCLPIGAAFGLALYAVNLYGFTAVFPWFIQVRDWITLTAHIVFGVTAAAVYRRVAGTD